MKKLFKLKQEATLENESIKISDFKSVNEFWKFVTQNDDWYLKYLPQKVADLNSKKDQLAPLIAATTNDLRYNLNFRNDDYWRIIQWDNLILGLNLESELKQFCSNCKNEVGFLQRYPKSICQKCKNELTSSDGRKVEFFNSEALGFGCQGYYSDTNQTEEYNSNESYIGNKTFVADEGRFGGIIIELKE
ncbi:hypothetical protein OBK14_10475 [Empedobacter falsenii]